MLCSPARLMPSAARLLASVACPAAFQPRTRGPVGHARGGARARILVIAGTRPECIKLAPLMHALEGHAALSVILINSGQHLLAVRECFAEFGVRCDVELAELPQLPHLAAAHQHLRTELRAVAERYAPAAVLVQGDTLTAYSAARAARDAGCMLAHIEAGLRTDAMLDPFPEEWFRRRIACHANIHFAPSASAEANLLAEGVEKRAIHRVGNTGIDSLKRLLDDGRYQRHHAARSDNSLLATLHRRANCDGNASIVCDALADVAEARPGLRILFPVHPNPRIAATIRRRLGSHRSVDLVEPMRYPQFVERAAQAALIVSDSGGIQEEAPHLGTPLLVPRLNTERPECLTTGFVQLVPVDRAAIVKHALTALDTPRRPALPIDDDAPFGAGDAARRIVGVLEHALLERAPT